MKRIEWKRIEDIDYRVRNIVRKHPTTANQYYAKTMIFLLNTISVLRAQNITLSLQKDKLSEKLRKINCADCGGTELEHKPTCEWRDMS